MRRSCELPPIFGELRDSVQFVQQISSAEYASECPRCGGVPHEDGEFPDRLRWFTDGHGRCWCRHCGFFQWADQGGTPPTPDALEVWRKQQIEREQARKRSAELALRHLRDTLIWQRYHDQLAGAGESYWASQGIDAAWQAFWQLGWKPDYSVLVDGQEHRTPAATIPVWQVGWQPANVKLRLMNPPKQRGKYAYELSGLPQPTFVCNPDRDLSGHVIAVEGEKKAMIVCLTLDDGEARVVGLPGVTPSDSALSVMAQAERVTLVLDPGTDTEVNPKTKRTQSQELVMRIGAKKCRVLIPPIKIDDAILSTGMSKFSLATLLRQARKA